MLEALIVAASLETPPAAKRRRGRKEPEHRQRSYAPSLAIGAIIIMTNDQGEPEYCRVYRGEDGNLWCAFTGEKP